MKKQLLYLVIAVLSLQFNGHAQVIDEWTFTDATTPQNSDIKNKAISTWDPALAGNSWAGGVLTWGYDNTSVFQTATNAWMGNPSLGVAGGILSQLVLTIDAKDINFSVNGAYGWQFTGGTITTGNVRSRINYYNGNVTMKMEGTGSEWSSTVLYNQADYTSITNLQLTFTWDLVNNIMSMAANGSGNLAAGGTGTISYSDSFSQDLSGIVNLTGFRTHQQGQGTSYMQLDRVAILANVPSLSTPTNKLNNAKVWYSKGDNALHIKGVEANSVKSVKVYSITGALVSEYDNPGSTITLGDLSSGLYIASIASDNGAKAVKFVK